MRKNLTKNDKLQHGTQKKSQTQNTDTGPISPSTVTPGAWQDSQKSTNR